MENFDTKKTCSFTGHRVLKKDFNIDKLEEVINNVLKREYKTFLVGMAKGFDFKCVDILLSKKKEYNIDIIACIPCKNQEKYFKKEEKEKYYEYLKNVDKVIYLNETYFDGCMHQRNRFMVENSSLLIAYCNYYKGGAVYTVNYAKKQNKEIINV